MNKNEALALIKNPITSVSLLASGVSIYSAAKDGFAVAFAIMFLIIVVLLGFLASTKMKYDRAKRYRDIRQCLHDLAHRTRDSFTALNSTWSSAEAKDHVAKSVLNVLNSGSQIFTKLTGRDCVASMMLENDDGLYQTTAYSSNVPVDRENSPSDPLRGDQGIIGVAFDTLKVQCWSCNNTQKFVPVRDDYQNYYKSGMTIPFHSRGTVAGVINIDSKVVDAFVEEHRDLGAMIADTMGTVLEMIDMWQLHNGSHVEYSSGVPEKVKK